LDIETKNIIDEIVSGFTKVLHLDGFVNKISEFVKKNYLEGMEKTEKVFNMNFIPQDSDLSFLQQYVGENVKDVSDDIGKQLRQEISRGILAGDDVQGIKNRVHEVFKDTKFTERLKTVLRTERIRAENTGSLQGAMQSRLKLKKYVMIIDDDRTSNICHKEHAKYGSPDQAIPLDEQFEVHVDNKTIRALNPPFHVNCFVGNTKITTDKGLKKIQDIKIGDNVLTHKNRFKHVTSNMSRYISDEIYEIETSKGIIEVTGEHPVMTNNGWKLVKDLKIDDWVLHYD